MTIQEALKISSILRREIWNKQYVLIFDGCGNVKSVNDRYEQTNEVLGRAGLLADDWQALVVSSDNINVLGKVYNIVKEPLSA